MEQAKPQAEVGDFPGLQTNADPDDLPAGASTQQVNVSSLVPGELRVRRGLRQVRFGILVNV
jgi:hypothetical protein